MEPAAILIAAFDVEIGGPGQSFVSFEHGQMARSGIEPDVENVGLFAEARAAAFGARRLRADQFFGGALVPDVGRVFGEELHDAVEHLLVGERFAAALAVEHR